MELNDLFREMNKNLYDYLAKILGEATEDGIITQDQASRILRVYGPQVKPPAGQGQ
jgi:hypothetical protein